MSDDHDYPPPTLDHHFRVPWDEEAGLQLEEVWRRGAYERQRLANEQAEVRAAAQRLAGGWIGPETLREIMATELKVLGRPDYHEYHLTSRFKQALFENLPREMIPGEQVGYWDMWIIPFPNAGREATIEMLRLIAYRGVRTGSLPKAVRDVLRSRKIKRREEQSRVVTALAK